MAHPPLPEDEQTEFDEMAKAYSYLIHTHKYDEALGVVQNLHTRMIDWQEKSGRRLHKGYPIHNIGYTLYLMNKTEEAPRYFLLAYIEDLLSADNADEADLTPAGRTLIQGYKYDPGFIQLLKDITNGLKKSNKYPPHPEMILDEAIKEFVPRTRVEFKTTLGLITVPPKAVKERPIRTFRNFDSEWEDRVFIGGSGGLIVEFNQIRNIVKQLGYDPIVAVEFDMPKEMTVYRKCLLLLHNCKFAIFDLTEQKGQLLEVERTTDYGVKTLLVWQRYKDDTITQMLKSSLHERGFKADTYENFDELEGIIGKFLPKKSLSK